MMFEKVFTPVTYWFTLIVIGSVKSLNQQTSLDFN
jgi:hypothetical protein